MKQSELIVQSLQIYSKAESTEGERGIDNAYIIIIIANQNFDQYNTVR